MNKGRGGCEVTMETETSFGALISRRRKALGLLQKELALQVGCSVAGLQKIERDERRPSRVMAERLAESLDVHADERTMFVLVARGERLIERLLPVTEPIVPIVELRPAHGRVPLPLSSTTLFGHEMELTAIGRLLHDP
ncbi:MAG TPA: helix-turn-helix transcriptional regulator [Burkholderiales bacterium]|nr:helix-turn-helix transcriptional regulator [Burkholderiales bacterium]